MQPQNDACEKVFKSFLCPFDVHFWVWVVLLFVCCFMNCSRKKETLKEFPMNFRFISLQILNLPQSNQLKTNEIFKQFSMKNLKKIPILNLSNNDFFIRIFLPFISVKYTQSYFNDLSSSKHITQFTRTQVRCHVRLFPLK